MDLNKSRRRKTERKAIRKVYDPIQKPNGYWRIRTNDEINELIKGEDTVKFAKSQRTGRFGHVERMTDNSNVKIITNWKPLGTRSKGRPRNSWNEEVEMDRRKMKTTRWKEKMEDRIVWNKSVEQAKTHPGLYSQ